KPASDVYVAEAGSMLVPECVGVFDVPEHDNGFGVVANVIVMFLGHIPIGDDGEASLLSRDYRHVACPDGAGSVRSVGVWRVIEHIQVDMRLDVIRWRLPHIPDSDTCAPFVKRRPVSDSERLYRKVCPQLSFRGQFSNGDGSLGSFGGLASFNNGLSGVNE